MKSNINILSRASFMMVAFSLVSKEAMARPHNLVEIYNTSPVDMKLHCHNGNTDMGEHIVAPNQKYEFMVYPVAFGQTKVPCDTWFGNGYRGVLMAYKDSRDFDACRPTCLWHADKNNACQWNYIIDQYDWCYGYQ